MMIQRIAVSVLALGMVLGPLPANAQIFGPSDEDRAREAAQDNGIQELQGATQQQDVRIRGLEDKVQGLTRSLSQATGQTSRLSLPLSKDSKGVWSGGISAAQLKNAGITGEVFYGERVQRFLLRP